MSKPTPTSSAYLTCLCGAISLPGTHLVEPSFPLPTVVCHCNPCRYTTGTLLPAYASLKSAPPANIREKLTVYQFTPFCVRYFCAECGCKCFAEHPQAEKEEWFCTAGMIEVDAVEKEDGEAGEKEKPDIVQLEGHMSIDDLRDGGVLPVVLPATTTGATALYATRYGSQKLSQQDIDTAVQTAQRHPAPGPQDRLEARCHCGGVDLRIKRAEYDSEPDSLKSMMHSNDPHRYLARFCTCRSCRLGMGFSLCPWTYVALSSVTNAHTSLPVVFGADAEKDGANEGLKLRHYQSSDGVWRSFCGGCGASVFYYTADEKRNTIVDVAVGLLRAESGSLGRGWVRWAEGEVSHSEECTDQGLVGCIQEHGRIV
jgi:hypothetical protein